MTSLDQTFGALADPTRRKILVRLARGEANVGELAKPFDLTPPAISRHLKVLERAALISNERAGKQRICRLKPEALSAAAEWLDFHHRFWTGSLHRLDAHLRSSKEKKR